MKKTMGLINPPLRILRISRQKDSFLAAAQRFDIPEHHVYQRQATDYRGGRANFHAAGDLTDLGQE